MRAHIISMLLLQALIACMLLSVSGHLQDVETTLMAGASPTSTPLPVVTLAAELYSSGIHQELAVAPTEDPPAQGLVVNASTLPPTSTLAVEPVTLLPVNATPGNSLQDAQVTRVEPVNVVPPPTIINHAVDPVPPAPAPTSSASSRTASASVTHATTSFSNVPFVTVQWVETFIDGTYSTWWPHTISLDFKPQRSVAPAPGRGEIGMGTLTGKTGQTQTVVEVVAAAPTQDSGWAKGVAVMVGVGVMGVF